MNVLSQAGAASWIGVVAVVAIFALAVGWAPLMRRLEDRSHRR
jgi:hypothetical protein